MDRADRREELARAVWTVALSSGVDALSVRRVADAAGCSLGTVQYYFPTKQSMLEYAFHLSLEQTLQRILGIIQEHRAQPMLAFRLSLESLLPLTPESAAEGEIWFGFMGLALSEERLRRMARLGHSRVVEELVDLARAAQRNRDIGERYSPEAVVTEMLALVDGLGFLELYHGPGRLTPRRMTQIVDNRLESLSHDLALDE